RLFYTVDSVYTEKGSVYFSVKPQGETHLAGLRAGETIKDGKEEITRTGKKITKAALNDLRRMKVKRVEINPADLEG
ncbi:hypothetical protein OFC03_32115, partial [Escherichia coli]|nr:hypothetical protein [Escherichia coli]